jgi:hypothetical protein
MIYNIEGFGTNKENQESSNSFFTAFFALSSGTPLPACHRFSSPRQRPSQILKKNHYTMFGIFYNKFDLCKKIEKDKTK